jgi:hypothetical protein
MEGKERRSSTAERRDGMGIPDGVTIEPPALISGEGVAGRLVAAESLKERLVP